MTTKLRDDHLDAYEQGKAEGAADAAAVPNIHRESVVAADKARSAERAADLQRRHNASVRGGK